MTGPYHLRLVLEFENALVGIPDRDTAPFELIKEGVEENGRSPIGRHRHSRDTIGAYDEWF